VLDREGPVLGAAAAACERWRAGTVADVAVGRAQCSRRCPNSMPSGQRQVQAGGGGMTFVAIPNRSDGYSEHAEESE
jgi:hypothetical protein